MGSRPAGRGTTGIVHEASKETAMAMKNPHSIEKAKSTSSNFVSWFKWGTIIVAILTAVVVLIIA